MATNVRVYFVQGMRLQERSPSQDKGVLAWATELSTLGTFQSSSPELSLQDQLDTAVLRWEHHIGQFRFQSFVVHMYRAYPDWCIEVHYDSLDALSDAAQLIRPLEARFFAQPFDILTIDTLSSLRNSTDAIVTTGRLDGVDWRISRTPHSYCSFTEVPRPEQLIFEGCPDSLISQLFRPISYIEYDLRIMRRNIADLGLFLPSLHELDAAVEAFIERHLLQADSPGDVPALRTWSSNADVDTLHRIVSTLTTDTFTAALDLENYLVDVNLMLGDSGTLADYYLSQSRMCYTKAKLFLARAQALTERAGYAQTLHLPAMYAE